MTGVELALILLGAFGAGVVSALAGFGGGILYLPLVVAIVGPREAVPLITFGLMFSNLTRVAIHWRRIVWPLEIRYIIGAIPGAALGAVVFVNLPADWITKGIGAFLIASALFLVFQREDHAPLTNWAVFLPLGAVVGFFSNLLGAVGPTAVPFFLATGLRKEAFVGTMAFGALMMHVTGVAAWCAFDIITGPIIRNGLLIGALMIVGTYAGNGLLQRLTSRVFMYVVEGLLVVVGLLFLVK